MNLIYTMKIRNKKYTKKNLKQKDTESSYSKIKALF